MEHSVMHDPVPFVGFAPRKISSDEEYDGDPPADLLAEHRDDEDVGPSSFRGFDQQREPSPLPFASSSKRKSEEEPFIKQDAPPRRRPVLEQAHIPEQTMPTAAHDRIWGTLYMLSMCIFFSVAFVVWLHTDATEIPGTDTIYRTLHQSMHLLLIQTFVAIGVSVLWMYLLRSAVKPFAYTLLVAVPIAMFVISIYAFAMSFKAKKPTGQDQVMRWGSIVPAIVSGTWVYAAWKGRNALHRAVGIVQLSCKILGDNPALVILSFATLIATCLMTWIWVGMFTRAFLTGTMLLRGRWIWSLNSTSVSLAIFYIMMYLWTLGILSNLHRATSSATVSQWYFHRHTIPRLSSFQIARAAFAHSSTTIFGTLSFHSFLSLLVRLPLIVAPRRIASLIHIVCFQFIASPITALISPLTLTFSAIHSQPLISSSRTVSNLAFLEHINHSIQKNKRSLNQGIGRPNQPVPVQAQEKRNAYRLAKMMLTATRGVTAAALGMAAWIQSRGSVYGYLVGLIGGTIGWAILGATEGCLGNVVDAVLVCVATEEGTGNVGTACREAQLAFGG
ncbi:hypothetical protein EX30DRAFT_353779 [Ascodesmis nigricans]|uniref:Protein PNS1 n=1 Tax=Ascodesmis nigricans TaxID=341454 RepID=A0A4S2N3V4_9PEZI|nr:hypothetical protein EX30DRAFT_353779 [Ascodesmis nigricans]